MGPGEPFGSVSLEKQPQSASHADSSSLNVQVCSQLFNNKFSGGIPTQFSSMSALTRLFVCDSGVRNVFQLFLMIHLQSSCEQPNLWHDSYTAVWIEQPSIDVSVVCWMFLFSVLIRHCCSELNQNQISGTIPPSVGMLSNLTTLWVHHWLCSTPRSFSAPETCLWIRFPAPFLLQWACWHVWHICEWHKSNVWLSTWLTKPTQSSLAESTLRITPTWPAFTEFHVVVSWSLHRRAVWGEADNVRFAAVCKLQETPTVSIAWANHRCAIA